MDTNGDELEKETEMLSCEPTRRFVWYFPTSCRWSPVDTGVWRIRLFQSVSLSHSRGWSQYGTSFVPLKPCGIILYTIYMKAPLKHGSHGALIDWFNHEIPDSFGPWLLTSRTPLLNYTSFECNLIHKKMTLSNSVEEWWQRPNHGFRPHHYYLPAVLKSYKRLNKSITNKNLPVRMSAAETLVVFVARQWWH